MTIKEFARHVTRGQPKFAECYVAVMQNGAEYDLEVEVSADTIKGVFATNSSSLTLARELADQLDRCLTEKGIKVFRTRDNWENWLYKDEEGD